MTKPMVTLGNGKQMPLEEFVKLAPITQNKLILSPEKQQEIYKKLSAKVSRAVITPKGEFPSVKAAAKALNMNGSAFGKLLKNNAYPEYRYVDEKYNEMFKIFHKVYTVGKKETVTPNGTFRSRADASRALGIPYEVLKKLMVTNPQEYYFSKDSINKSHEINDGSMRVMEGGYKRANKVVTPLGIFSSRKQASLAYFLPLEQFQILLELHPKEFYFIEPIKRPRKR
jgi:hypothetical protein